MHEPVNAFNLVHNVIHNCLRLRMRRAAQFCTLCSGSNVDCGRPAGQQRVAIVEAGCDHGKYKAGRHFLSDKSTDLAQTANMVETDGRNLGNVLLHRQL